MVRFLYLPSSAAVLAAILSMRGYALVVVTVCMSIMLSAMPVYLFMVLLHHMAVVTQTEIDSMANMQTQACGLGFCSAKHTACHACRQYNKRTETDFFVYFLITVYFLQQKKASQGATKDL